MVSNLKDNESSKIRVGRVQNNMFKSKNRNTFYERKLKPSYNEQYRGNGSLNESIPFEFLHFKEEISNYGHLSDSPLPITPWYNVEEFEEFMQIIYDSVYEAPKNLPPDFKAEHLHELFVKREARDKIVHARLKVRTWKLRSMNIEDGKFLTEFLSCLERLLNYLIAKTFQHQRLAPLFYEMKGNFF